MNREIRFRGKCQSGYDYSNGDGWVFGSLLQNGNACGIVKKEDIDLSPAVDDGIQIISDFGFIPVITETVGQFTGLHDIDGRDIYEGDIVKNGLCGIWIIQPLERGYFSLLGVCKKYKGSNYHISALNYNVEVIGNIHDNPELINQ